MKKAIVGRMIQSELMLKHKMAKAKAEAVSCTILEALENFAVVKFDCEVPVVCSTETKPA